MRTELLGAVCVGTAAVLLHHEWPGLAAVLGAGAVILGIFWIFGLSLDGNR